MTRDRTAMRSSSIPASGLNESQRRHLATSVRHVSDLLDESERILTANRSHSPFPRYDGAIDPTHARLIAERIAKVRDALDRTGRELGLDVTGPPIDARHALQVQVTFAGITIEEIQSRFLRAYGAIDSESARRVDAIAAEIGDAITQLESAILSGTDPSARPDGEGRT